MKMALVLAVVLAGCGGSDGKDLVAGSGENLATCAQPASCDKCIVMVSAAGACSTVSGCCTCAINADARGLTVTFDGQLSGMVAMQSFYLPQNVAFGYGNSPAYSPSTCTKSFGLTWPDATASQRVASEWSFSQWLPQWGTPTH